MSSPGAATDELTHTLDAELIRRDGYTVVHTREFPGYHCGNCLVYDAQPRAIELPAIQRTWQAELGARPDIVRFLVAWAGGDGWSDGTVDAPFVPKAETVNLLGEPRTPQRLAAVQCRPLVTDVDWRAATSIAVAQGFERFPGEEAFTAWRYGAHRERCEAGHAQWWGAFRNGELVGSAGLYESLEWARFQAVQTRIADRNQGVCTTLVHAMVRELRDRRPAAPVVMVSEPASQAERIYHGLGFECVDVQWEISAPLAALP